MKYKVSDDEAKRIAKKLNLNLEVIDLKIWKTGMNIELEHGYINTKTNVTNNNLLKTGKIALAHLLEDPGYYQRLVKMEKQAEKYWSNKKKPNILI